MFDYTLLIFISETKNVNSFRNVLFRSTSIYVHTCLLTTDLVVASLLAGFIKCSLTHSYLFCWKCKYLDCISCAFSYFMVLNFPLLQTRVSTYPARKPRNLIIDRKFATRKRCPVGSSEPSSIYRQPLYYPSNALACINCMVIRNTLKI